LMTETPNHLPYLELQMPSEGDPHRAAELDAEAYHGATQQSAEQLDQAALGCARFLRDHVGLFDVLLTRRIADVVSEGDDDQHAEVLSEVRQEMREAIDNWVEASRRVIESHHE